MKEFWKELNLLQKIAVIAFTIIVIAAHIFAVWALIDITILISGAWVRALVLIMYTLLIIMDSISITFIFFD